jgi:SAM-dependent methyltransferase
MTVLNATAPTVIRANQSGYAKLHLDEWVPAYYDGFMYGPSTFDTYMWQIQRPIVVRLVEGIAAGRASFKYLDFACGTGRVIAAVEHLATESLGLDISPTMLAAAGGKVHRSTLKAGDILTDPGLADADYDVITVFRFFLGTEPEMRHAVLAALASRLRGADSRLIFNMHGNRYSALALANLRRLVLRQPFTGSMSIGEVRRLVDDAGLEIESTYGFGLCPPRLYRTPLGGLVRRIDRWAAALRLVRPISQDLLFVCRPRRTCA